MTNGVPGLIVGLTGGIGSGKSAVAERFAELGADVVDTDEISHGLTRPGGAAIPPIRSEFGAEAINTAGGLDRAAMRALVFSTPERRRRLEAILHPMIRAECERQIRQATSAYVILAVPLLIETGHLRLRCDRVCVVDCPENLQIARVMLRSNLDEAQVQAIIATQASRDARIAAADDVIDNSGDLAALRDQVDALHERYLQLANRGR